MESIRTGGFITGAGDSRVDARSRMIAKIISAAMLAMGGIVLFAWMIGGQRTAGFLRFVTSMSSTAALSFVLCSLSLWFVTAKELESWRANFSRIFAVLVAIFGLSTLAQFLGRWECSIDELIIAKLFPDSSPRGSALLTSLVFALFGFGLMLLNRRVGRGLYPSDILVVIGVLIASLALMGHLCKFPPYYSVSFIEPESRMSMSTSLAFVILGVGILHARPRSGLMGMMMSNTVGGVVARRLLPAAIIIPFALGALSLLASRKGDIHRDMIVWLLAFTNLLALTAAIWWNAGELFRVDLKRYKAEARLKTLNNDLEARVAERTVLHETANRELQREISAHRKARDEIQRLNLELEKRVAERTEQLQASNKELESFCYSVSHDLRAPLRSIDGFAHALAEEAEDKLNHQQKEYLQIVRSASRHMSQLIDDLLHLSRLNNGHFRPSHVDLVPIANRIIKDLQRAQPERKVEFVLPSSLIVKGDERLLSLALQNLISNAWKFTGKTALARIELGMVSQEGKPTFFITDNGAGFDMAHKDKLFRAFQRLHSTHDFPGHGIGLATVQRIINRHGGKAWAKGAVDQGATFYFTLPE